MTFRYLFMQVVKGQQGIWPDIVKDKEQKCMMYGKCTKLPDGRVLNCYTDEGPKPLADEAITNLTLYCSEMVEMYRNLGIRIMTYTFI